MTLWIAAILTLILMIAFAAWWWVPKWQSNRLSIRLNDPKALADIEDNWRKTISQLFAGGAVLIAGAFAYLQFVENRRQFYETFDSQQVAKAFEEIGNDNVAVRIGGIYALEGTLLRSGSFYRLAILEALSAFVRDKAKKPTLDQVASDVQAALTVIGRNYSVDVVGTLYLEGTYLTRVNLQDRILEKAHFAGAHLSEANLHGTRLSEADLSEADLSKADLRVADISNAMLSGANLSRANLMEANLRSAVLHKANLSGANLGRANLSRAVLQEANLSETDLSYTDLHQANLIGANLSNANLRKADLSNATLSMANLRGANLSGSNLRNATVSKEQLMMACGDWNTTTLPLPNVIPNVILMPCP